MLLLYLWVQSERTIEPISVHGGVQVADMFELKLQLPLYVPSVITKQPDMLARARGPVPLKPSAPPKTHPGVSWVEPSADGCWTQGMCRRIPSSVRSGRQ